MEINGQEMLEKILDGLEKMDYIHPEDVPGIDLYMDQVTTFMDRELSSLKRSGDDKILTKTMINNYSKNHLLPPPEKKKYSREHMFLLIFIYYLKNILSITDIQALLTPLTEKYFHTDGPVDLNRIYSEIVSLEKGQIDEIKSDLSAKFETAKDTFADVPGEDGESLRLFSFICMLSFDVYTKKQVIEKLIDGIKAYNTSFKTDDEKSE